MRVRWCLRVLPKFAFLLVLPPLQATQNVDIDRSEEALVAANARLAELPEDESATDWRTAIQERIRLLNELLATRRDRDALPTAESLAARLDDATTAVEALIAQPESTVALTDAAELTAFERAVGNAQAREKAAEAALADCETRRSEGETELQELPQRSAGAEARGSVAVDPDANEIGAYRAATARLELSVARERDLHLNAARVGWKSLEDALAAEVERARLVRTGAQARLDLAREQATQLRSDEAERARQKAEASAREAARQRDPLERFRLEMDAEVAAMHAELAEVETDLQHADQRLEEERRAKEGLAQERKRIERRLDLRGDGAAELLARNENSVARGLKLIEDALLPAVYEDQARNQQRLADSLDRLWQLQRPDADNDVLAKLIDEAGPARADEARALFGRTVDGAGGVARTLRDLQVARERLDERFAQLEEFLAEHRDGIAEYVHFLRLRQRWVRGIPTLTLGMLQQAKDDVWHFAGIVTNAQNGRRVRAAIGDRKGALFGLIGGALTVMMLGVFGRRWRRRMASAGDPSAPRALLEAVVSLLVAFDLPVVFWLTSRFLHSLDEHMIADPAFATLLLVEAKFLLTRRVMGALLAPRSRAVRSGLVPASVAAQILRSVFIFTWGGQLFAGPHAMLIAPPYELASFARLCELMWLGSIQLSILLLLGRNAAIGRWVFGRVTWLRAAWGVLLPMLVLAAAAVMVLYGLGYAAGARHVIESTGRTTLAAVGLVGMFVLLNSLGNRAVLRVNERLAIEGELEAALDARFGAMSVAVRAGTIVVIASIAIVLQRTWGIGEFTIDLLRSVHIFHIGDDSWLTGANVLFAVLWIVAGHFLSRNLGRVFEHFVEPLAGSDSRGEQLAWLTLTRYGILSITWAAALLELQLDLSTLGWLLTAVSVGLGFGLQEIVANFVSGLILLFEKPIRVGDVITVGHTGGTVDRITIRSTVVTNWEHQTIIVPNKNFITQEVTNWTRQDLTVRRKLKLGVARGTDVDKVIAILEEVIDGHPGVLLEPPHRIWFQGYGEYTLDFEVWFFATFGDGLRLKTELYKKLVRRLKEEGIDVPIPSRAIKVEHGPDALDSGATPPS